ncbi:MAG: nickel pincer cofactor biosynthesis protein LarB [Actinomycetia bacterium]|nr:nickel pincer cofactor biosynthesis protein LarB [Actinomycetes bacterium]
MPSADPLRQIADLDLDRARRRGYPEAVYGAHKTPDQLAEIALQLGKTSGPVIFTRMDRERAQAVTEALPGAVWHNQAGLVTWPGEPPEPSGGLVVVACAGTSDLPVAEEARLTARYLGRPAELVVDVGVAGLHRVLGRLELLRKAAAIVVVAGMDGALPSVVAGLVAVPVVACPTSVGYGASLGGVAALLSMLNACSPGVAVVNIDNGYGAGYLAAQIAGPEPEQR